jgi:DNA-binding NtrC family response regulator
VACTDPEIRQLLFSMLKEFGVEPALSETLDDTKALLTRGEAAVAFVQPRFSDGSFRDVLGAADGQKSKVPVIICSEFYDKELYIEAMGLGAFDYLALPYRREEVAWIVNNALGWGSLSHKAHA